MFMLHTIGYSPDDMTDDVAVAKRFVVRCWSPALQQYQPQVSAIEDDSIVWEITVPEQELSGDAVAWCVAETAFADTLSISDEQVTVRFRLPNKPGTHVAITKNYKENNNGRKSN